MLQRGQLLSGPISAAAMGLLTSLLYVGALGWPQALAGGTLLGLVLGCFAGWMAYRSDCAARHLAVGIPLYMLLMGGFAGGGNLMLMQLAGFGEWSAPAWLIGVTVAIAPTLGAARAVRRRLSAEGDDGPWVRQHLDLRKALLNADGLLSSRGPRPSIMAWQVGALAANLPLLWRLHGGQDTGLLALAMVTLAVGLVWGGVAQAGPALGKAWFVLDLERRTGLRLRNSQWDEIQDLRRNHWLARWFMRDAPAVNPAHRPRRTRS